MSHFFATKRDLITFLTALEKKHALKYVLAGSFSSRTPPVYSSGLDLPNLGIAGSGSAVSCATFLVCEPELAIRARSVKESSGNQRFDFDQLLNPDTITFSPGGIWKGDILLYGRFATVSAKFSVPAKRLMQRFSHQMRKQFVRIGAYYVGSEAQDLLKAGNRLTIAEQSPRDFDLKPD
ncbi:MAG TPA: hypothetical protein VGD60_16040 [Candidatus Acidoferrales bacterium]